ncbi:ABC transporter substrate-binding protein [Amycolatopsis sp. NPDC047767]|uniref:ABC transporter substrate-binding protein n=1 Tax=Amycolatopsis sp. NPDC047767 TaxID=3156765 RepID=UPI003455FB47
MTFAVGSDAGCVDPQQVSSNDTIYSLRQIVDSLTDQDPATGKIVPWLAQSWDISPDATTFTFHLRPGVTFSDGSPLTAQVVKDNFDAVPKLGALGVLAEGYLSGVQATTVVDPSTVRVQFSRPNAQFLQATSTFSLGIESSASAKKRPQDKCSQGVIGSGPFVLKQHVANQSITLAKRTGYDWGSSLWRKKGEAYLDQVVFKVVPEAGVRQGSLQSGQVDAIGSVGKADEAALKAAGVTLLARANPGAVFNLGLNNSRPALRDERVRQALQVAVDREQIVDTVFPTGTRPATSVLSHTTPDYADQGPALAFDAAKAKALLDSAGWTPGGDGIRQRNGARLSLNLVWFANAATNQPALELVQQQLKAVGVDVVLKQLPIAQLAQAQTAGDFDLLWGNLTRADPDILRGQYSTQLANVYRIPAPGIDELLTRQAATTDAAQRKAVVAQAQQEVVRNAYVIPVVELQTELGVAPKVHDLDFEASSRIQLHDTWLS